ncbi:hypothetical protein UY3_12470 [Chelonia mydas]|uniref:Secreted protein n=1 Tax=Chelonia mydas TaxID=8469 RepID=M7BQQ6_CHEMY|nr:hypothetical protein UY3_12470 [Chelonia mydas]
MAMALELGALPVTAVLWLCSSEGSDPDSSSTEIAELKKTVSSPSPSFCLTNLRTTQRGRRWISATTIHVLFGSNDCARTGAGDRSSITGLENTRSGETLSHTTLGFEVEPGTDLNLKVRTIQGTSVSDRSGSGKHLLLFGCPSPSPSKLRSGMELMKVTEI